MSNNRSYVKAANAAGTPGASIDWVEHTAPSTINVFFAAGGSSVYDPAFGEFYTAVAWDKVELAAAKNAFQNYSDVANVKFNYVSSIEQADFVMVQSPDEENLGHFAPGGGLIEYNGALYDVDGLGVFSTDDNRDGVEGGAGDSWTHPNLQKGGYGYITLIHEIGHGMGLAHPHDDGGGSEVMHGVDAPFDDLGDFSLNQGINTIMSYNDGWRTADHVGPREVAPDTFGYGWQGSLMALDIAVLQEKYGANTSFNTGDNTYVLPEKNASGTYYSSIWDAGGKDTIIHNGSSRAVIDLGAATLDYSWKGGGPVSYADGIYGGFTIANGAVIEIAIGGSGNDKLIGNGAANVLNGRGGADIMRGLGGSDTYYVNNSNDLVDERNGNGSDTVAASIDYALDNSKLLGTVENLVLIGNAEKGVGNALNNTITGSTQSNWLDGAGGDDRMIGLGGNDTYTVNTKTDVVSEIAGSGVDTVRSGVSFSLANTTTVLGAVENLTLINTASSAIGNALNNRLIGNARDNWMKGGLGADTLTGGQGADTFVFESLTDSGPRASLRDTITDFRPADEDRIDLSAIDARLGNAVNNAFSFLSKEGAAFTNKAGQLRFDQTTEDSVRITLIEGDVDGDGKADFQIELTGRINLVASDFVL